MLEITGAVITYAKSSLRLIYPDINLAPGEFLGLAGESGSGKSSLLEALISPWFAGSFAYTIANFKGRDILAMGDKRFQEIGYCPQYSQNALNPKLTIKRQIALCQKHNPGRAGEREVDQYLAALALDPVLLSRYPAELSGGEKQRFVLLLSMLKNPDLLFLDEPSSAIDLITLQQISEFLLSIKGRISVLMISHDLEVLSKIMDRTIYLGDLRDA